ncbi:hypothetical protein GTP55_25810 [Duganella sp. FT109W]|uniref:Plasmid stabilization protein n=1 Tax=Duganella margarita TaxID=2692170 RepID=A0ABW9WNF0_9BURK|nr:hypothetical protein [Duganella margarita]MYN42764.1 hypothetical protein [Duganella margarita]
MTIRPNRINIDLGAYKQRWLDYCAAQQITPSAAFRQVVAKLMEEPPLLGTSATPTATGTKVRREIGLTSEEAGFVRARAHSSGMSEQRWIISLLRGAMRDEPQLSGAEMAVLGKSNLALLTIARHLQQIARALQAAQPPADPALHKVLETLHGQLTRHIDSVAQLLASNAARWGRS